MSSNPSWNAVNAGGGVGSPSGMGLGGMVGGAGDMGGGWMMGPGPALHQPANLASISFLDLDNDMIARQLNVLESDIFRRIKVSPRFSHV